MNISIRQVHPVFVGEVSGIDITQPLTRDQVAAIEAGMDRYAVLVFRDQSLTDEQQLEFSRNFGELEVTLAGQMAKPEDRRLGDRLELGDISNLTARNELRARDDSSRMYALANRLWHSDASFRAIGAGYTLLHGRIVPGKGGNTEFADMRAAYDALDDATKAEIEDLVTEHSIVYLARADRVFRLRRRQRRQAPSGAAPSGDHAPGDRAQVAVSVVAYRRHRRLADAGGARLHPRPDRARDPAGIRLCA